MNLEDYIKECLRQLTAACAQEGVYMPKDVEFCFVLNDRGNICKPGELAVCNVKVRM